MNRVGTRPGVILAVALAAVVAGSAGCAGGSRTSDEDRSAVDDPARPGGRALTADELMDFGEDWADRPSLATPSTLGGGGGSGSAPRRFSYWTVVLGTFSAEEHAQAAANMARSCQSIDPRLADARVHTTSKGSMVVYGAYEDVEAPAAQEDLEWIQAIRLRDRPVFPRALLTRLDVRRSGDQFRPNELLSVRVRHPRVNPLYSLQVAVWGTFDDDELSPEEVRARAEAYTRELRARGHEAYFHHDEDQNLSVVTVGLFDRTAIDPASGLLAPEVEMLLKAFPVHLVNGEVLHEPVDSRLPALGTREQRPKLVLVPEL